MPSNYYQELVSRNKGLLSDEEQTKIRKTRILIAGCGVGSLVATAAVRFGFENFVLADGDKIEISNLNRQEYTKDDVGINKATALKNRLLSINPQAKIKAYPKFVKFENVKSLLKGIDIIIDAIDPEDGKAILYLHQEARKRKIWVISPYDTGYGSHVFAYYWQGKTYKEILGFSKRKRISSISQENFYNSFVGHTVKFIPSYLIPIVDKLLKGEIKHFPQPIIAAQMLSSLVVNLMKKISLGQKIKGNPYLISFDPELIADTKVKKYHEKKLADSRRRRSG